MLIMSEGLNMFIIGIVAILIQFDIFEPKFIYPVNFLLGSVLVIAIPAQQAFIPSLVTADGVARANSTLQFVRSLAGIIGPALGGWLVGLLGVKGITWLNFASFVLSFLLLRLIKPTVELKLSKQSDSLSKQIVDGLAYLLKDGKLLKFFIVMTTANVLLTPFISVLPTMAKSVYKTGSEGYGLMNAIYFTGIAISYSLLAKVGKVSFVKFLGWAVILVGVSLFGLGLSTNIYQGIIFLFSLGMVVAFVAVTNTTFLQSYVPNHLLGRVMALRYMTSSGIQSLGVAFIVLLAETVDASAIFAVAGILTIIVGLLSTNFMWKIATKTNSSKFELMGRGTND